jgi:hypothetical protein
MLCCLVHHLGCTSETCVSCHCCLNSRLHCQSSLDAATFRLFIIILNGWRLNLLIIVMYKSHIRRISVGISCLHLARVNGSTESC